VTKTYKFKVGDKVRVTGDAGEAWHSFETGTVGEIIARDDVPPHYQIHSETDPDTDWWVDEQDLELVDVSGVDVKILTAALLLNGVDSIQVGVLVDVLGTYAKIKEALA